jgi:hypothetical protein
MTTFLIRDMGKASVETKGGAVLPFEGEASEYPQQ